MAHADGSVGTAVPAEPDAERPALTLSVMIDACCAGGVFALPVSGVPGPRPQFPGWTYYILPAITLAAVSTAYTARAMRSELSRSLGSAKAPASGEFFTLAPCAYREATFGWLFAIAAEYCVDYAAVCAFCFRVETVINARAGRARDDR